MPRYRLYGLSVRADRPIAGLAPDPSPPAAPALDVALGALPPEDAGASAWYVSDHLSDAGEPVLVIRRAPDGSLRLRYGDGTEFAVEADGSRAWGAWPPEVTAEDAATYLLGPLMGLLLRLRGVTCLHASAVETGGRAVLLAGPSEAGKSTTAAAFAGAGHGVLSDDVSPLLPRPGGGWEVPPAYPQLRLWPDAAETLFGSADALPRLTPTWEKRRLDLALPPAPLPLGAIVLLAPRAEDPRAPFVEPVPPGRAAAELAANVYMGWLPDPALRARDLRALAAVAAAVPVLRATPHTDPARLSALREAIVRAVGEAPPSR